MALKKFNPVTPSLRGTVLIDRSDLWKGKPVKGLTEGKTHSGGRNNHGRITSRFRGGGHKQTLPRGRFQAPQVRRAGEGRAAGIRSEPHGVHRPDQIPGRRTRLHSGAATAARGRHGGCRRPRRHQAGQRHAAGGDPGRHDHSQYRTEARRRRQDRARRGHLRPAGRQGCRLRADQADVGRVSRWCGPNAWPRSARCRTPTT